MAFHISKKPPKKNRQIVSICLFVSMCRPKIMLIRPFLFFILFLHFSKSPARGRVCRSTDVRNHISSFKLLEGCVYIDGDLLITLMDMTRHGEFDGLEFPELREIRGFFAMYRVRHVTSVGKLFPNLQVIRGENVIHDFSMSFYDMAHLKEIALPNLVHIARGLVKVDKCPMMCFVDTVRWENILSQQVHYRNMNPNRCPDCPAKCKNACWNEHTCQKFNACHKECIDCTKDHSARHCTRCKNMLNEGECVPECPPGKYVSRKRECVTKESLQPYQPVETHCDPVELIDSLQMLQDLRNCTHVDGNLDFRISADYVAEELLINLENIRVIDGYLKILRSSAITNLYFLRNLKEIRGNTSYTRETKDGTYYAIIVYENPNLQKLWDFDDESFDLKVRNGKISFHNNPLLCLSEIETLANKTNITFDMPLDVSHYSNGDNALCKVIDLNVNITNYNTTNITMVWDHPAETETVVGYTVFYIEHEEGNITYFQSAATCEDKGWDSKLVTENKILIKNLKPYTRYAYYIKLLGSSALSRGQTPVEYFTTLSEDPELFIDLDAISISPNSIKLVWNPPKKPNGVLAYYSISVYMEEDVTDFVDQRDYCEHPHYESKNFNPLYEMPAAPEVNINNENMDCCAKEPEEPTQIRLFNQDIMSLCPGSSSSSFGDKSCYGYKYDVIEEEEDKMLMEKRTSVKKSHKGKEDPKRRFLKTPHPNMTSYVINDLKHFTMYVFYVSACNEKRTEREQCSSVLQAFNRTHPDTYADDIKEFTVNVENNIVTVAWEVPKNPNSVIVSYHIEYKNVDLEHSGSKPDCITRLQFAQSKYKHEIRNLSPGTYSLRVQAVSLAGPGNYSKKKRFVIEAAPRNLFWWIVPILVLVFGISTVYCYIQNKRKSAKTNNRLIRSVNPDYSGYVEDEWELDREDIELQHELGQGVFGTVYSGLIKSKNLPCAVKTVNDQSLRYQMEFLNEASVMKTFSGAHHVVKLLGVVSRDSPLYVVMELMDRGDLKSFLRRSRESASRNITTNEMYRMSAEIADGMAYLTAKKFVHRDLATRNCMVAADYTVKIGDFGMTRDVYETDYYRKETRGLLPIRWMAPESLKDGVFTIDSDMWSYGVVLWEIATLAEQPYQGLHNEQVLQFVLDKGTLHRPNECPELLYDIMKSCWKWRPNDRPTFFDIVQRLEDKVGVTFNLLSFYHSREGCDYRLLHSKRAFNPPAFYNQNSTEQNTETSDEDSDDHDLFGMYRAREDNVELYVGSPRRPSRMLS